ncbi:MAG: imidazoleglycerol-phosphate dehydratase HisB [Gammaproteobacteria bacterium]|nr:imidazoleglycerol-phosphate dehydratase HisB [Gammaproteobacteria bacterium]
MRNGRSERKTLETNVRVTLSLDGTGKHDLQTRIGFLDHMLSQIARHGLFDLEVRADGDLHIDAHHTVEDVGICIGQAFDDALGDRSGIARMGSATVPMEESLALVAVDVGGRPMCDFQGDFSGDSVGQLDTQLIPHFISSLADNMRANIHVHILSGGNDHHRAEAVFKALARSLDVATALDPRRDGQVPSTKGSIVDDKS